MKRDFLKSKKVAGIIAAIAFLGGFILTDRSITGNIISESSAYSQSIPLIGLGLLACALLLAYYSVKKE